MLLERGFWPDRRLAWSLRQIPAGQKALVHTTQVQFLCWRRALAARSPPPATRPRRPEHRRHAPRGRPRAHRAATSSCTARDKPAPAPRGASPRAAMLTLARCIAITAGSRLLPHPSWKNFGTGALLPKHTSYLGRRHQRIKKLSWTSSFRTARLVDDSMMGRILSISFVLISFVVSDSCYLFFWSFYFVITSFLILLFYHFSLLMFCDIFHSLSSSPHKLLIAYGNYLDYFWCHNKNGSIT